MMTATLTLYMVEHLALRVRKVGLTTADRLKEWRRKGWTVVQLITYTTEAEMHAAERLALTRLDQLGARATPHMEALFQNITDGRTEMFDPAYFPGNLAELLGPSIEKRMRGRSPAVPLWISEPRHAAAKRAWDHPNLAKKRRDA